MSELIARDFLRALFHAVLQVNRKDSEGSIEDAFDALHVAAGALTASGSEASLRIIGDAFYLDRSILANASTEFDSLLKMLKGQRIDTITISPNAARSDLADLAALACGKSDDLPAQGTVMVNDRFLAPSDLEMKPLSSLRRTYADSLDTLRGASKDRTLHVGGVLDVVDDFLSGGEGDAASSLLMATVHNRDELTYYHSVNVCLLSLAMGRFIGLDRDQLRMLGVGAMLHDVGRVVVDEAALHRRGRLSNEDWAQVRLHPQEGAVAILAAAGPGFEVAAAIALEHHVRVDGSGYPDLGGRKPNLFSRMVAVVDTYEAVTAHRPYRPARTPNEALRILLDGAGKVHDADLVRLFIEMMGTYPPGSLLRLDNGETVLVLPEEGEGFSGIVVREPDGSTAEGNRTVQFAAGDVVAQLLASEAGVDPGSLVEVAEQTRGARR
jgi:HD-GYP domain-containing protein (c-di-GMP phosphodiesterase class II)